MGAAADIQGRIAALDPALFSSIECLTGDWDRRALLALHEATAARLGSFRYLEIGSFRGGSLQAVMQDPRCTHVLSIDPHPQTMPDKRGGTWTYGAHSTAAMVASLRALPAADVSKLTTFDAGTGDLDPGRLGARADYCFIDGEHTDEAALRDARFCRAALDDGGLIAFHDAQLVKPAVIAFLSEVWPDVSYALAFAGSVFALELGGRGILRAAVIDRAVGPRWHELTWKLVNRRRASPAALLAAWSAMGPLDVAALQVRAHSRQALARVRQRGEQLRRVP